MQTNANQCQPMANKIHAFEFISTRHTTKTVDFVRIFWLTVNNESLLMEFAHRKQNINDTRLCSLPARHYPLDSV